MNEDLRHEIQIDAPEVLHRFRVEQADIDAVAHLGERIQPHLRDILDDFETWVSKQPESALFGDAAGEREQRIEMQLDYWLVFFRAHFDAEYVKSRVMIGELLARVGVPIAMYVSGTAFIRDAFTALVQDESVEMRQSLNRVLMVDMSIVVGCYPVVMNRRIASQARSLSEMSTPVTELWDRVLMLPLVGIIDSNRANQVMTSVLSRIAETRAKAFIMDISGVSVVDTAVANHLISIAKASGLMGCTALLSGVSPEIASTIVALGIEVGDLRTHATLQDALNRAFGLIGVEVVPAA